MIMRRQLIKVLLSATFIFLVSTIGLFFLKQKELTYVSLGILSILLLTLLSLFFNKQKKKGFVKKKGNPGLMIVLISLIVLNIAGLVLFILVLTDSFSMVTFFLVYAIAISVLNMLFLYVVVPIIDPHVISLIRLPLKWSFVLLFSLYVLNRMFDIVTDTLQQKLFLIVVTTFTVFLLIVNKNKVDKILFGDCDSSKESRRTKSTPKNIIDRFTMKEGRIFTIIAIILFIIAFAIRIYRLGDLSLWWDEIITGRIVTRIHETGLPLEPSGNLYYWRGIAYHLVVLFFTSVFDSTEFWIRFPSVLFGMGILLLAFIYARKINSSVGIFTLVFLTFSPYAIESSRIARFYIMNSFLFLLSIWLVYKGFYERRTIYKWLSMLTFFIMLHTVQLGGLFLVVLIAFFILEFLRFLKSKDKIAIIKQNYGNIVFGFISLVILWFGNIPQKLYGTSVIYAFQIKDIVVKPAEFPILKFPDWSLFKFFDQYYIAILFVVIGFVLLIYGFFRLLYDQKKIPFFMILGLNLFLGVLIFEVMNRDVEGARVFQFAEPLIVIVSVLVIFIFSRGLFKSKLAVNIVSGIIILILLAMITPSFYEIIDVNYGDNTTDNPFKSTHVALYRADYKTTYEYLDNNMGNNDIWVNVMGPSYFTIQKSPQYILNQNYRWNTASIFINQTGKYYVPYTGSELINKARDITEIIENNTDRNVWIVVNGGSINVGSTHVRQDFLRFLSDNKENVVYTSDDNLSRVLLFPAKI